MNQLLTEEHVPSPIDLHGPRGGDAHPAAGNGQGPDRGTAGSGRGQVLHRAFVGKDLQALKGLLAPDAVLYEHSVRNIGLDDVWEHHLRPEVAAFEDTKADFTDMKVWVSNDLALVTRQYAITATMNGRAIDARRNETMGWALRDGAWKVVHIHYSHPCPRTAGRDPEREVRRMPLRYRLHCACSLGTPLTRAASPKPGCTSAQQLAYFESLGTVGGIIRGDIVPVPGPIILPVLSIIGIIMPGLIMCDVANSPRARYENQ